MVIQIKEEMWTDQPGRWFAVLVFSPWLWWRGCVHRDVSLLILAFLPFGWDTLWLLFAAPRELNR
jgi:hypothetical protein